MYYIYKGIRNEIIKLNHLLNLINILDFVIESKIIKVVFDIKLIKQLLEKKKKTS